MRPWWRRALIALAVMILAWCWARWGPMDPLFQQHRSTVLLDRNGDLLGATVALDGQWRMPPGDSVPRRFETCLTAFEDRHFRSHPGIHLPSLIRAAKQNFEAGRVVSGGSTLTMQLARMARGDRPRTLWNKLVEAALAIRCEIRYSKDEILALYAANAPFGGNVVGLEAAAWRWYGRSPELLGWAECATLAVLPNAPARIHPGRDRAALRTKRDRLLDHLAEAGTLDRLTCSLAKEEPLPDRPHALPQIAPHLLATLEYQGHRGLRIRSTIDPELQQRIDAIARRHARALRSNEVHNAAMLVLDVPTGNVLAYLGNLPEAPAEHAGAVDIIQASRSTGSLLKPFLYADMLQSGELMPDQLVADLPTHYQGFAPKNYDARYDGAVHASEALARSLNVPAVRALHRHGIERTLHMLHAMGFSRIDRTAGNYGLSLIVGGAESSLWEITGAYASMMRILLQQERPVHPPNVIPTEAQETDDHRPLSPAAVYHTIEALQMPSRPDAEAGWQYFADQKRIAWKTGTSFGHRDAWAVGVTERYAVGVWTGNADGEGRPGLTGTLAAAPMLFEAFGSLPDGDGITPPYDDLVRTPVCRSSGHRAGPDCSPVDTALVIREAERTPPCPYHRRVFVRSAGHGEGQWAAWFALPPGMEHFYRIAHPEYRSPPDGAIGRNEEPMELIYPEPNARLFIPMQLDGTFTKVVLHAAHRDPNARLDWDLDGQYLGRTMIDHRSAADLPPGPHRLTLTDQDGRALVTRFHVTRSDAEP